mmetsp:Transcript_13997/g.32588  ORF Transcript_13997/g.32588 Transcript_13997/m.32588 type:complete len:97 (+) Transcript_13997:1400-1690(+)
MHRGREEEEEEEPFLMFRARVVCCDSPVCGCGWVHGCVVVSSVSCVCVCVCVCVCHGVALCVGLSGSATLYMCCLQLWNLRHVPVLSLLKRGPSFS